MTEPKCTKLTRQKIAQRVVIMETIFKPQPQKVNVDYTIYTINVIWEKVKQRGNDSFMSLFSQFYIAS